MIKRFLSTALLSLVISTPAIAGEYERQQAVQMFSEFSRDFVIDGGNAIALGIALNQIHADLAKQNFNAALAGDDRLDDVSMSFMVGLEEVKQKVNYCLQKRREERETCVLRQLPQ